MADSTSSGLTETLDDMRLRGLITEADAAVLAALEGMALSLDEDPSNAALWRVYVTTLQSITSRQPAADDDMDKLLKMITDEATHERMSASLGDPSEPWTSHPR